MDYCHQHNLVDPGTANRDRPPDRGHASPRRLEASLQGEALPPEAERDAAFERMAARHGYYRKSDKPTQILEKISR